MTGQITKLTAVMLQFMYEVTLLRK